MQNSFEDQNCQLKNPKYFAMQSLDIYGYVTSAGGSMTLKSVERF